MLETKHITATQLNRQVNVTNANEAVMT